MALSITPLEAAKLVQAGQALLVDVRESDEYRALRIAESELRPLSALPLMRSPLPSEAKNMPVIFFCHSGRRTGANEALLDKLAPGSAHILEGGISAWRDAGLPVVREKRAPSLERQVRMAAGGFVLLTLALSFASPAFLWGTAFIGAGLVFSGVTGACGLARVLAAMPWNRQGGGME